MQTFPDLPGGPRGPWRDPQYLLDGSQVFRSNMPRSDVLSDTAALTTQVLTSVALPLMEGDTVAKLAFRSGATPAGTPTNWWFALYDDQATAALIAQTADQLTAAWAANTVMNLALTAPYIVPRSGIYYAACMVKATTPPTLSGATVQAAGVSGGLLTGQKALAQTSGSALTTTAPATIATPTAIAAVPLVIASKA